MKTRTEKPAARWVVSILAASVVVLALVPLVIAGQGNAGNPGVLPPQSQPYGMSYGDWGVAWWQWALSIPEPYNPVIDDTGEDAGVGQSGPVFFLAGTFGGDAERTVTVPRGKALFFPIVNIEWDNMNWSPPPQQLEPGDPGYMTVEDLYEVCAIYVAGVEELHAMIDGVSLNNLLEYRGTSPGPFTYTLPEGVDAYEWLGYPPEYDLSGVTFDPVVCDGYWLMVAPLPPGAHEISFGATVYVPEWDYGFSVDVIYHITVE